MAGNELSRRAQKILHAVVTEYLQGGDAVGSRTVTRRHDLKLSPATVRNVMADLEELGLLEQRHSSAGRVPERIEAGWWEGDEARCDYFVATNARGERYWVYREHRDPSAWYL